MNESRNEASPTAAWWFLCALSAELAALVTAATVSSMWTPLALHIVSALAFGVWAADGEIMSRPGSSAVACVLVLTLPILGAIGVCVIVVPAWRTRRPAEADGVIEVAMPSFSRDDAMGGALAAQLPAPRTAPIELTLRSGGAASRRVASVMSLRHMEAQRAVPLLRVALCDPHEDVRLLAYALLERREKELRAEIDRLQSELQQLPAASELTEDSERAETRGNLLRCITEQHWELVHGAFVSGDLEAHTLRQAVDYGHESLLLAPHGSLALLLARIRLRQHDARGALKYLRAADVLGIATSVLAPHYAEVAFLLRRFDAIEPLLAHAGHTAARPRLDAVAQFWTGRDTA